MKTKNKDYLNSEKYLKKLFARNTRVYTSIKRVSSSGMSRHIKVMVARKDRIIDITWHVGHITGYNLNKDTWALVVGGCGMDMGFHLIYSLSCALYPKGYKLPKNQKYGRNGDTSGYDKDGGYRLKQEWL
jgi:hypothetical protein